MKNNAKLSIQGCPPLKDVIIIGDAAKVMIGLSDAIREISVIPTTKDSHDLWKGITNVPSMHVRRDQDLLSYGSKKVVVSDVYDRSVDDIIDMQNFVALKYNSEGILSIMLRKK
jgi:hypothetical protein